MNSVEGKLFISIFPESVGDSRVTISSSRPLGITRMLIGKTPEQVLEIIPMLFNICGIAQSRAALSASMQDMNIAINPKLDIVREILLQIEIAREHLLRIFLDWPKLLDINSNIEGLVYINGLNTRFLKIIFSGRKAFSFDNPSFETANLDLLIKELAQFLHQHVFSAAVINWLDSTSDNLSSWAESGDTLAAKAIDIIRKLPLESLNDNCIHHLPELNVQKLLQRFDADDAEAFISKPNWGDKHYETTSLSRQLNQPLLISLSENSHHSLLLRWVARLVELARIPQKLNDLLAAIKRDSFPDNTNKIDTGLSQIETARGRLIHRVKVRNDLVSQYQILAPTEWNFHSKGIVTQSLAKLNTKNKRELKQFSHLLINAIDPCVGYELKIH